MSSSPYAFATLMNTICSEVLEDVIALNASKKPFKMRTSQR